jgi:NhaA family Na+:H+ antiporter
MMTPHALPRPHAFVIPRGHRLTGRRLLRFVNERFLWLPLGAAIALVWANLWGESYFRVAHALAFPVNEIGMALFLGLIVQETLEGVMPGGALHSWRRWSMPLIAAAGGILGAAFTYLAFVSLKHEAVLVQAWPIACAVDVAAGYYVLRAILGRSSAVPFLLVIGIATNAAGLAVLALWPAFTPDHLGGAVLILVAMTTAALLRRSRVRSFWPYVALGGGVSWLGFYSAGVHPALALVPIVPFLPREPRPENLFADPDDDRVHHAEHEWNAAVQVVLFLFALVNAGILLRGHDTGTWAVLIAALIGRPAGILLAVGLAVAAGLHLPRRLGWRELIVIALATSSGFTFALFAAATLLPLGAVLTQVKLGALATAVGAVATLGAASALQVGRRRRADDQRAAAGSRRGSVAHPARAGGGAAVLK